MYFILSLNKVEEVDIDAEFEGEFEDFDLDSIIRQSDSPLLQELLAVDNVYNQDGTVALEGKGWFDSEQVREERRRKKLKQILKMVFFLQVSYCCCCCCLYYQLMLGRCKPRKP